DALPILVERQPVLLPPAGSSSPAPTSAQLSSWPPSSGAMTVRAIVSVAPAASEAAEQLTIPPASEHENEPPPADTNCAPAGRVSVICTLVAVLGPALLTARFQENWSAALIEPGPVLTIETSDSGVTSVEWQSVLLPPAGSSSPAPTSAQLSSW